MSASASTHVSIREFARREGCDEKLIRDAIKRGKLTKNADGRLDSAEVGGGWRKRQVRTRIAAEEKSARKFQTPADAAEHFADDYPDFARSRLIRPNGCLAIIERLAFSASFDQEDLWEELDTLAWGDKEADRQLAEWHRWPTIIAPDLAVELGIPDRAEALETGLRRRIVQRLERDYGVDAEIYLAPATPVQPAG